MNMQRSDSNPFDVPFEWLKAEAYLRNYWTQQGFYKVSLDSKKPKYSMVMPPPNVTGDLTLGHVLNNTLQDILIRWHRAAGYEVCWVPGTDHASIATEAKVTKMLEEQGIQKAHIGRDAFLKHAWEWKRNYGDRITNCLKLMGISCDWDLETFTLDANYSQKVLEAFVQLYQQGFVYKSQRLVNWCPVSQSVISDEEVNHQEQKGFLWHIRYVFEDDPSQSVIVATTRPETLFGDVAVAVHPEDPRYQKWIGRQVRVPLTDRVVPIIGDSYVEKGFGTGALKITPAHDLNDFEIAGRHSLPVINIMNPDATLNSQVPKGYQNLDRYEARKKLVSELEDKQLLEKTQPHILSVGISERGQVPIEFYLSEQWYIKTKDLAQHALQATRSGQLTFTPAYNEKIWEHWLTHIKDWCVSRQLWWGHRIPIHTCQNCGHVHCAVEMPKTCEVCHGHHLVQDPDVLDTWASAWFWPFAVFTKDGQDLKYFQRFYPTDVLVTGADIIFFWVARMVMAGQHFTHQLPFGQVYFTPLIRDKDGRKMSKSLGNSPKILQLMETYSTDAVRFAVIEQAVAGQDISWKDASCEVGQHFCNKLWQLGRFLMMQKQRLDGQNNGLNPGDLVFPQGLEAKDFSIPLSHWTGNHPVNRWIGCVFNNMVSTVYESIEKFEFSKYTKALYSFAWMTFCDWFIELVKPIFAHPATPQARDTLRLAFQIFDGILKLLHPLMPFVTETLWLQIDPMQRAGKTIGLSPLPKAFLTDFGSDLLQHMDRVQAAVVEIRGVRGQFQIHPSAVVQVFVKASGDAFGSLVSQMEFLAKAQFIFDAQPPAFCAPILACGLEMFLSLENLVDIQQHKDRLLKRKAHLDQLIASVHKRLNNREFLKGAPEHILQGARVQLETQQKEWDLVTKSLDRLQGIN